MIILIVINLRRSRFLVYYRLKLIANKIWRAKSRHNVEARNQSRLRDASTEDSINYVSSSQLYLLDHGTLSSAQTTFSSARTSRRADDLSQARLLDSPISTPTNQEPVYNQNAKLGLQISKPR